MATATAHDELVVILATPPKELKPNSRVHRMAKANAVRQYRCDASYAVMAETPRGGIKGAPWPGADITIRYFHPTKRHLDADNILASLKAAFDGLTDSGLITDDAANRYQPVERYTDKHNPRVELVIRRLGQGA